MRHPALPDSRQRLKAAQVYGEVERLTFGPAGTPPVAWCVARLHEITTDPVVLGHILGSYLAYADRSDWYQPAVVMLRAAGADEAPGRAEGGVAAAGDRRRPAPVLTVR
jgi:hypothetical protein